jgi:hypothetical protein
MKALLLMFALVVTGFGSRAAETNDVALLKTNKLVPLKIGAADATNYYGKEMTVTGRVAQVTIRPAVTFLNLDKAYPNSPFAVVIFHGQSSFFGDVNALKGKQIEVRGKIIKYKGKPEIALDTTNQLTVLDLTNSVIKAKTKRKVKVPAVSSPDNAPPVAPDTNSFPEIM